jgi:hypothetical protein
MERDYDLFERFPDGSPMWRGRAKGLLEVRRTLAELSTTTSNECFAMHLPTKDIVARVNVGGLRPRTRKRLVCQIAYDPTKARARTEVLRAGGYEVVTVIGNEAAKLVLDLSQSWNFFMIGNAAPREVREEMVAWLKAKFPGVPILALNPPTLPVLRGADYNVEQNGPERWLPLISDALPRLPQSGTSG